MKNRILKLVLVLIMALTLLPITALSDEAEGYQNVAVGENNICISDKILFFEFVPKRNAEYSFKTLGSIDIYGVLYDGRFNQLTADDDGSDGLNFLITYNMKAGASYYVGIYNYDRESAEVILLIEDQTEFNVCTLGENSIFISDAYTYFEFVPQVSGGYRIQSIGAHNTLGVLCGEKYDVIASDDDSGGGHNFALEAELEGGKTYYIGAGNVYGSPITVSLLIENRIDPDLNGDGEINSLDLVRLKKYVAGTVTAIGGSPDINFDGRINALDLVALQKLIAEQS